MKERIINKITSARFIISILVTVVLCILALKGNVNGESFLTIATAIITYYFTTKDRKTTE